MKRILLLSLLGLVSCLLANASDELSPYVVAIYATSNHETSRGTGFWVTSSGNLVTAYHVITGAKEIVIYDYRNRRFDNVTVEALDGSSDLALLRVVEVGNTKFLTIENKPLTAKEEIDVIGYPRGLPTQTLTGRITSSALLDSRQLTSDTGGAIFQNSFRVFMFDVTIYGGMSGAPVIDHDGKVLGMVQASLNEGGSLAWAVAAEHLEALLRQSPLNAIPSAIKEWPPLLAKHAVLRRFLVPHMASDKSLVMISKMLSEMRSLDAMNQTIPIDASSAAFVLGQINSTLSSIVATVENIKAPLSGFNLGPEKALLLQARPKLSKLAEQLKQRDELRRAVWGFVGEAKPLIAAATGTVSATRKQQDLKNLELLIGVFSSTSPEGIVGVDVNQTIKGLEQVAASDLNFKSVKEVSVFIEKLSSVLSALETLSPSSASATVALEAVDKEKRALVFATQILSRYQEFIEFRSNK